MERKDIGRMRVRARTLHAGVLLITLMGCTAGQDQRPLTQQERATYLASNQRTLIADQSLSTGYSVLLSRDATATQAWCEVLTAQPHPTVVGNMDTDGLVGQEPAETPISVIAFWYRSEVTCIWINDPVLQQAGTELRVTYRDGVSELQPLTTREGHIFVRDGAPNSYQQVRLYDETGTLLHEVTR